MSRHALSYLQLTGAITPERASRIVVVSTPEGQRTPLPIRSPEQPPHDKGRDIPPGIARMLQQIRMPQARPQPLQPRREPRPNARTSRTAVLPTGPPMGFNVTSTPSPRVLSRPGQFSPSPAWSPAVTSSWHSVRHVSPEHWSPACTPGGGSDRQQDSPHLPPVLLAPLFESAMSTPRRDSTQSASDEDVQQYLSGTFITCQLSGFWHFSALSTTFAFVCKHVVTWGGVCVYFLKCARKRRFRNVWVWGGGLDIFQGSTTHGTVHTNTALHRLSIFIQNHCHCQHCFS